MKKGNMVGTKASQACARCVAQAIRATRKFNAAEHSAVMKSLAELRKQHPEYGDEIDERIVAIGNRSAFAKDLAKAGLVSEGEPSAWVKEIGEMVDALATAERKATEELTKK